MDEKGNRLSVAMIIYPHDGADNSYILTREGYLCKRDVADFQYENLNNKGTKHTEKKVKKIGTKQEDFSFVVFFEDGEELQLRGEGYSLYNLEDVGKED